MSSKGGNFIEEHVEKVVLAVVGLVCLWLFTTRVLFSPNKVKHNGRTYGTAKIDLFVKGQAEALEMKLAEKAEPKPAPESLADKFIIAMGSTVRGIDTGLTWPLPAHSPGARGDNRKFRIPQVAKIGDVAVEHIRTVAYVPTEEINKASVYRKDNSEPNDIDFVTVESSVDFAELAANFHECFAGEKVPEDWRDPCFASPVFAAVELQRRELLVDGTWSDWQRMPRTKIDPRKEMFEIIEDVEKLPPGRIDVQVLKFDNKPVMVDLLQPEAYRIASSDEEWFPPSVHKQYAEYQEEMEALERREAREAEKKRREEEREKLRLERQGIGSETMSNPGWIGARRGETESSRYSRGTRPRLGRRDGRWGTTGRRGPGMEEEDERRAAGYKPSSAKKKTSGKKGEEEKSLKDFYKAHEALLIGRDTDIAKMEKPLVFWAHDDTVKPGKSYQYRMRLGVFNPIAGTEQVSEQDKVHKNQVVLWSAYSDETETVDIPARLYFFAQRKTKVADIVTVKVCRYILGYWYSSHFRVDQGEVIGKVEAVEAEVAEDDGSSRVKAELTIPETIDYSTGAIYVDAILVNNWVGGKNMRARSYYDMLYSYDGALIEHIPIGKSFWAQGLQSKFNRIEELEEKLKKPLRDWGAKPVEYKPLTPKDDDEGGYDKDEEYEREMKAAGRL
jgi:hypothetical protein